MALEAVVFSQDPLITSCSTSSNNNNNYFGMNYDFSNYYSSKLLLDEDSLKQQHLNVGLYDINENLYDFSDSIILENNVHQWSHPPHQHQHQQQYVPPCYSSPEDHLYLSPPPPAVDETAVIGGTRRKRRRRSCKDKEEVEHQRMTHIAVERNRRKQMNEYLAVIRSLMPPSYVQRGDQASIVGGAINYVKELEQLLQSMEAQKRSHKHPRRHDHHHQLPTSPPEGGGGNIKNINTQKSDSSSDTTPPFADFFSFPQYSTRSNPNSPGSGSGSMSGFGSVNSVSSSNTNSGVGDIEVTMVESHANVKILAKKQRKQLVKLIAGFQGLRLNVLHLNVTTVDSFVLYSLSLKVEEGCQLNSVDDIASAANHILGQIQEEAASDHLLQ
ncbi:hypothetical protein SOVF_143930 [Spinacia oleracea]|nr:hypothetical protein SOVF_143930 [Spinacia oleracea]